MNPLRMLGRGRPPEPAPGGPATRAARPLPLRSPADDPPTDPHGFPPVEEAGPDPAPFDATPLVWLPYPQPTPEARLTEAAAAGALQAEAAAAGALLAEPRAPAAARPTGAETDSGPGPDAGLPRWPQPDLAEAVGLATAFAVDLLSWDETDPRRRGRVLNGYLRQPVADPAHLDWDGRGRQRAEFAVPGRIGADRHGRLLVQLRVRVTPYRLVRTADSDPEPDPGGDPASAPAPTARGWRGLAAQWVPLTVPVARDGRRLSIDRADRPRAAHPAAPVPAVGTDDPLAEPDPGSAA